MIQQLQHAPDIAEAAKVPKPHSVLPSYALSSSLSNHPHRPYSPNHPESSHDDDTQSVLRVLLYGYGLSDQNVKRWSDKIEVSGSGWVACSGELTAGV
jgi:hypothetical protein